VAGYGAAAPTPSWRWSPRREKLKSLDLRRPDVSAQAHAANIEGRKALEAEPY
jgi:hypothetical protein